MNTKPGGHTGGIAGAIQVFFILAAFLVASATCGQLIVPPEVPSHKNLPAILSQDPGAAESEMGSISGQWEGNWSNSKGELLPFTLYVSMNRADTLRAVGAAKEWTAWEVFDGQLRDGKWTLVGEKVVRNTRPESSYVLDRLNLETSRDGEVLEGGWEDGDGDKGTLRLERRGDLGADCPFLDELHAGNAASSPQGDSVLAAAQLMLRRIGPVEFGMTVQEAERALGESLVGENGEYEDSECYMVAPKSGPKGLWLMVVKGRVVRVDIDTPSITTKSGAKVGDSEARILSLYQGHIKASPHEYAENGKYLFYIPTDDDDRQFRMIFDSIDGVITLIRAGELPAVAYVEGCL